MEFLDLEDKTEKEIVFEVFDLNDLQRSLFEVMEQNKITVKDLAEEVDRNRSTVQRALQEMMDKDIIMREGKTDRTVYYVYTTLPMEDIKQITRQTLEEWYNQVENRLS